MKIHSIFPSISGEVGAINQGEYCVFIRTSGCNLDCPYCDAIEAKTKGLVMSYQEIMKHIQSYETKNVIITGGEPLLQPHEEMRDLCNSLKLKGYTVSIETNGSIPLSLNLDIDSFVVDYKLDFMNKMYQPNFRVLRKSDFIKFVVSRHTVDLAIHIHERFKMQGVSAKISYSPLTPVNPTNSDNDWIKETREISRAIYNGCKTKSLPFIINVQLHKILSFD